MSLSFPETKRQACTRRALPAALVLTIAIVVVPAQAAQTYIQPQLTTSVEHNTNRNLSPIPEEEADITGYIATAELLWGYVTPTTHTKLLPRLRFQRYPDREDIQRTEQFLDFSTEHRTAERSMVELVARYSRQDVFNSELEGAEFDDFDPEDPTEGGDGTVVIGTDTRTRVHVRPGFTHEFSEVTGFYIGGVAETVRFESDLVDRTDFDYLELRTLLTRRLSPRTKVGIGPVASRYETRDDRNQTDDYGVELAVDHEWSEITRVGAGFFVRRSDIEFDDGITTVSETDTNYGFDFNVLRVTEVGRLRFNVGRTLRPTSSGNMVTSDQVRVQHDYDFSERLSMRTAVRAYSRDSTGTVGAGSDRDYARAELRLTYMLTRTMFVGGGYQYTWRDVARDVSSADNHAAFVSFGYRGLGRQQ